MTTILTGVVHVRRPGSADVTTLNVGDELPEWAVDLVTNPAVLGEYNEPDLESTALDPVDAEDAGEAGDPPLTDVTDDQTPPTPDATRGLLEGRAKELKIKFTDETTDTELEALIDSKG